MIQRVHRNHLQKNFRSFVNFLFLLSIFHSIFYRFTDWNGDEIHSSEREEIFFFFSFQQDFGESIVYIGKDSINFKKITRIDVVPLSWYPFHQVRIDYSLILYNALSIFIYFHLQNFYIHHFFHVIQILFPISLSI